MANAEKKSSAPNESFEEEEYDRLRKKAKKENRPQLCHDEYFICPCGNDGGGCGSGFYPCLPDGTVSDWPVTLGSNLPTLYLCDDCLRIVDEKTMRFVRRRKCTMAERKEIACLERGH